MRQKATGWYLMRATKKKHWSADTMEVKYWLRRTRQVMKQTDSRIPKDAEIAEIDTSKLKWEKFFK